MLWPEAGCSDETPAVRLSSYELWLVSIMMIAKVFCCDEATLLLFIESNTTTLKYISVVDQMDEGWWWSSNTTGLGPP